MKRASTYKDSTWLSCHVTPDPNQGMSHCDLSSEDNCFPNDLVFLPEEQPFLVFLHHSFVVVKEQS